jgi:hypothetical protein
MNQQELSERLWDFAARVGKVVHALPDSRLGRHVTGQLVEGRAGEARRHLENRAFYIEMNEEPIRTAQRCSCNINVSSR